MGHGKFDLKSRRSTSKKSISLAGDKITETKRTNNVLINLLGSKGGGIKIVEESGNYNFCKKIKKQKNNYT